MIRVNYATDQEESSLVEPEVTWSSPSRTKFLVEVSLKHSRRGHHMVGRSSVFQNLDQSINDLLWGDLLPICKLWALFAIGELLHQLRGAGQGLFWHVIFREGI